MEITIFANRFEAFREAIRKLNRKAEKLHNEPISYVVNGETVKKVHSETINKVVSIPALDITVTGPTPQLAGWSLLAKVEVIETGKLFASVDHSVEIDPRMMTLDAEVCEHCNTNRRRKQVYIVRNADGQKQVGRTCLKDFTGHDPERALRLFSIMQEVAGLEEEFMGFGPNEEIYDTEKTLALVGVVMKEFGWISRGRARETFEHATADIVADIMMPGNDKHSRDFATKMRERITEADYDEVREIREWVANVEADSDYLRNLKLICASDVYHNMKFQHGLLCSARMAWEKATKVVEEEDTTSEYVGEVKKRECFTAKLANIHSFEGYYGLTHIHKFIDEAGNVLVWMTASVMDRVGETIKFKATVKKHEEFRNVKQTVLSRLTECDS